MRRRLPPFEVEIERLGPKGTGVGVAPDGKPVLVRPAPPGARLRVIPSGRKKGTWQARRDALIRPPADAEQPPCDVFGTCGGCQLQELGIEAQRREKLAFALEQVGPIPDDVVVHPIRGARPYGYRNKVELSFGVRRYLSEQALAAGEPIDGRFLGFHAPGRFDRVVDVRRCWLAAPGIHAALQVVREHALREEGPPPYDNRAHTGFWRHLLLREGERTGQRLAVIYTTSEGGEADVRPVAEALRAAGVDGVQWAVNDGVADVARGEVRQTWGQPTLEERLGRVTLRLSAHSFLQTNTEGAELLYDAVGEALADVPVDTLLDLYCGIGSIGLYLADRFPRVEGVEEVEDAVADARENAARNGVDATFRAARVEDALDAVRGGDVAIVVDPPRAGLHPKVARKLAQTQAGALVYVACNPASLGRDREILEAGWRLTDLWIVDLFPQTGHIEVVARFLPREGA